MSDSESDGFRIADDSGSDDFAAPAPKAKKVAPAKKAVATSSKATKVCRFLFNALQKLTIN
jgi:hypothetical protein